MKYKDADQKLKHAMRLFVDACDHHETAHTEARRASRYYHNSDCEGQWEPDDLKYLRQNQRMALTFNILKTKIDTFLGMYSDAQRIPIIAASGNDTLAAEIIDAVKSQLLQDANYESLAARVLKTGTVEGECSMHIEVLPSDEGEGWIKINLWRVLGPETLWDTASVEPDRSDARYVFWFKWLDEDEFTSEYPDAKEIWSRLRGTNEKGYSDSGFGEFSGSDTKFPLSDYGDSRNARYFFDTKANRIRVIRYEYKHSVDKKYALDLETGQKLDITDSKDLKKRINTAIATGAKLQIIDAVEDKVSVCEFVADHILAEFDEAGPFQGFSLVPYCYEVDEETGTSYGFCRNLFDPQMELNKARSLDLELTAQATTPGTTAEEGAIPDTKAYERERRRPNGVALVARGAISEGKIQERQATPPSALAAQRSQAAMELLDEVSGIPSASNLTAAEHQQAGVTVAIRYHKSKQTVSTPFSHFETSQKKVIEKIAQVIVEVMPDDQIMEMLGTRDDLVIQGRRIIEIEPGPPGPDGRPGQPVPKRMVDLNEVRDIKWHLDMEYASENSTLRMLELNVLLQVAQVTQMPMDPEVLIELSTASRSYRERLKKYLEKAQAAGAEQAKAEAEALQASTQGALQIEGAKVQETSRHNKETERLNAIELMMKTELEKMKIYAEADDTEKGHMLEVVKMAAQAKMQREKLNSGGSDED